MYARHASRRQHVNEALDELRDHLHKRFGEIAEEHGESASYIRRLFFYSKGARSERQVSLSNALISQKAEELNKGMTV